MPEAQQNNHKIVASSLTIVGLCFEPTPQWDAGWLTQKAEQEEAPAALWSVAISERVLSGQEASVSIVGSNLHTHSPCPPTSRLNNTGELEWAAASPLCAAA
jgi:hypothetical protein